MGNKTQTVSYRNKHILTIVFVIYVIVLQIFPIKGILKLLVYVGYAFIVGTFVGTYEKKDELTKQTLAKATEITFYVLIALLFVGAIVIENINPVSLAKTIAIDMYFYILLGAIALRSILFLWFDRTPKEKEEE
ncbi:MAG: hypothetical protein E7497_01130 [Ruminococcus sp.]|nr:hypothetical protein [Ruminococcus sp.]